MVSKYSQFTCNECNRLLVQLRDHGRFPSQSLAHYTLYMDCTDPETELSSQAVCLDDFHGSI